MDTTKIREALNWMLSNSDPIGRAIADGALRDLNEADAEKREHLRDTFAAAALTGLMANMSATYHLTINGVPMAPTTAMWVIAESALEERKKFDDAMLKAREGK